MKVAFISLFYLNISFSGGSLYAYHLAHSLNKKVDLTVFIPNINSKKLDKEINYVTVDIKKKPIVKTFSFMSNIKRSINIDDFDIIHVNEIGGLFLDRIDALTFHHTPDTIIKRFHNIPTYFEAKKSSVILTVSNNSKIQIKKIKSFKKKRIEVLPNGINPIFLKKEDVKKVEKIREKYKLENKKVVLYINSNFTERKNLPLMIKTAKYLKKKLPEFRLIMLINSKYNRECKKLLIKHKIDDITILLSNQTDEELFNLYHLCDLLAMPSTREGFGFPLIESIAAGKPFISFNVGIALELTEAGFGFIAKNSDDFIEKCLKNVENPIFYTNSKSYVRENYSWKFSSEKLIQVYDNLI